MDKKQIEVAGYFITQLDETEYEAENKERGLDFHFDTSDPAAVEVFVFDSERSTGGEQDPCIAAFYAEDLRDAVRRAMTMTKRGLQATSRHLNVTAALWDIVLQLDKDPNAETKTILFPGWHEEYEGEQEQLVKEAARAILAEGVAPDEGTYVTQKAVAALIQYLGDMME